MIFIFLRVLYESSDRCTHLLMQAAQPQQKKTKMKEGKKKLSLVWLCVSIAGKENIDFAATLIHAVNQQILNKVILLK